MDAYIDSDVLQGLLSFMPEFFVAGLLFAVLLFLISVVIQFAVRLLKG